MNPELAAYAIPAAVGLVVVVLAFFIGRRSGGGSRALELAVELEQAREEASAAAAESEELRREVTELREDQETYRLNVVEHFSGTSDLLRDMTVQYRAVYEHLTKGASTLCPEGFVGLTEGLPSLQLDTSEPGAGDGQSAAPQPDDAESIADAEPLETDDVEPAPQTPLETAATKRIETI